MEAKNLNKQIKYGVVLQYFQMGLSIIASLIYTPIMLRLLGKAEYGIYSLASSIISYLNVLSLGFSASYIRYYSRHKAFEDNIGINRLNSLYLSVFIFIGIVALGIGIFIANNVAIFFNETYSTQDIHTAENLMLLLAFNLAISFPASLFTSFIISQEKFIFQKLINMGKTIFSPCLSIIALHLGYGSIGMVVVTTIVSMLIDIINLLFCVWKLNMRFFFGKVDFFLLSDIAKFSIFIAINQIIDQINWQTDKLVLGKMIDSTAVSIYTVAATINTMYINFSTSMSSVFVPRVHRIVSEQSEEMDNRLSDLFIKVGRIQFFVITLILTGFIFFGKYFVYLWAGNGYEQAYGLALCLMCPVSISLVQTLGIEIQRAKNKHYFRSIIYSIIALLNVGVSILLCHIIGLIGVALGTTISLVIGNGLIMNIYYQKGININVLKFWRSLSGNLPSILIPITFGIYIMKWYNFHGFVDFAALILVYILIYVMSIYFIGLKKNEQENIKTSILGVVKKFIK